MVVALRKSERGQRAYHAGLAAEGIVERDYLRRGQTIAARRWRGRYGEIDLICRDGDRIVFVEVKQSKSHDQAVSHITRRQMQRICASATDYVTGEPKGQLTPMRIDVALVDGTGAIKLIENASMMW